MPSRSKLASAAAAWKCVAGQVAKSDCDISESQDSYKMHAETSAIRLAVADGATMSSGQAVWAQILVHHAVQDWPDNDFKQAQDAWLAEPRREWQQTMLKASQSATSWFNAQAVTRPAAATLLGVECRRLRKGIRVTAFACGDTCVLITRDGQLHQAFPLEKPEQFNSTPKLLSSIEGGQVQWARFEADIPSDYTLLLATDAVAEHLLGDPRALQTATQLSSDAQVEDFLRKLQSMPNIVDDDLTLIALNVAGLGEGAAPGDGVRPTGASHHAAQPSAGSTKASSAALPHVHPAPEAAEGAQSSTLVSKVRTEDDHASGDLAEQEAGPEQSGDTSGLPPDRSHAGFSLLQLVSLFVIIAVCVNMLLYVFVWPLLDEAVRQNESQARANVSDQTTRHDQTKKVSAHSEPAAAPTSKVVRPPHRSPMSAPASTLASVPKVRATAQSASSISAMSTPPPNSSAASVTAASNGAASTSSVGAAAQSPDAVAHPATGGTAPIITKCTPSNAAAIKSPVASMICCENDRQCSTNWEMCTVHMHQTRSLRSLIGHWESNIYLGRTIRLSRELTTPEDKKRLRDLPGLPGCSRWLEVYPGTAQ